MKAGERIQFKWHILLTHKTSLFSIGKCPLSTVFLVKTFENLGVHATLSPPPPTATQKREQASA